MSNRFHNKLHRINHHSQRTPKNDTYTDASYDPIASYEAPFQGEFYSDGELVTHTYLSAASAIFTNDGTIFNDLFVGNNVTINNGLSVETDLLVKGNFTVLGSTSQIDTLVYVTSAMSITNVGTGPALLVNQTGNNIVADFRDDGVSSLFIDGRTATAGFIGINTSSPNERLTVVGNISARGNLIVTQNVSISGNQAVLGSVFVSGSQFIEDDLTVYRNTFLETLTAESPTFESYVATLGLSGAALDPNPFLFLGRMGINGLPKDTNSLHIQGGNLRIDGADYSTKDYSYLGGISALDTDGTALLDLRSSDVNQKYTLSIAESGVQNFLKISGGTLSNPQPKIVVKEGVPLLFGTHSSFFDDSFIEKVRIDSNGNVGIGESSPQQKLTVKGNVSAAGDGIFTGNFYLSGNEIVQGTITAKTLNMGSTDDIVIKSSTNVLETREINNRVWNTTANLLSGALTQNYLPKFESGSSLVNSIVFDDGTFVGINTITPTATLDVSGSFKSLSANVTELFAVPVGTIAQRVSAQGAIRYNTEANTFEGYSGIEWGPIGGGALIDANKDTYITVDEDPPTNTDQITFYTANTAMMIILSSGNVGIGELNPQEKLTVNGSISASNTVYISAVEFTGITTTATSITADNLFIQVNIGGVQKYIRLFDIE